MTFLNYQFYFFRFVLKTLFSVLLFFYIFQVQHYSQKNMSTQSTPSLGIEFTTVRNVKDALTLASSQKYDFLVIPIIRKQYGTDLLTTYGSKQSTWPAIASRLKGVGESADMSTALVALIRHVIDVDSPNLQIRNKATKVKNFCPFYLLF
jgi:hypothetical protein